MKKINIGQIIISVAAVLLVGTLAFVFLSDNKSEETFFSDPVFQDKAQEVVGLDIAQKNAIRSQIISIHTELNLAVGYGGIPTEQNVTSLRSKATYLRNLTEEHITYDPLAEDIQELIGLLNSAVANDRNSGWITAHRIAHDLDYFLFNPRQKPGVPFGVTKTLPALANEISTGN